eukprot:3674210-Prymnesium_polylepis.1
MSIAVLQSLRLMACMSAHRDNLRVWRESSSTAPATRIRTGEKLDSQLSNTGTEIWVRLSLILGRTLDT